MSIVAFCFAVLYFQSENDQTTTAICDAACLRPSVVMVGRCIEALFGYCPYRRGACVDMSSNTSAKLHLRYRALVQLQALHLNLLHSFGQEGRR